MTMDTARILLVDDNISIIENLEMVLQANYFNVDTDYNGRDALHKIESDEYDLVICDIEMPGISGLDFLSTVHRNQWFIIFFTCKRSKSNYCPTLVNTCISFIVSCQSVCCIFL